MLWGSLCYVTTVGLLSVTFDRVDWNQMAQLVSSHQIGVALENVVGRNESMVACVVAGITFLIGAVLLGWPPPSRNTNPTQQTESMMKEAVR